MAEVYREDLSKLDIKLTVEVTQAEYEKLFHAKLLEKSKTAQLKGFRAGKAPIPFLKKMFGKGILYELVFENLAQKKLSDYIKNNGLKYLYSPLLLEQSPNALNVDVLSDFRFDFMLGLEGNVAFPTLGKENAYDAYAVVIDDKTVEEEFRLLHQSFGKDMEVKEEGAPLQTNDTVRLKLLELDEAGNVKTGGLESYYSMPLDAAILTEEAFNLFASAKIGDVIPSINVYTIEKDRTNEFVRQYVLGTDKDNEEIGQYFQATVTEVKRIDLPEINQELFDNCAKALNLPEGNITSAEGLKQALKEKIEEAYMQRAKINVAENIFMGIMKDNEVEIPELFLKEWLIQNNHGVSDNTRFEEILASFKHEIRRQTKVDKLVERYGVQINKQDMLAALHRSFIRQYGQQISSILTDGFLQETYNRLLKNGKASEEQVKGLQSDALVYKLLHHISEDISYKTSPISQEAFLEIEKNNHKKLEAEELAEEIEA